MLTRRRVVLQQTEQLDLKPGDRNFVVDVVVRVLLLQDDLRAQRAPSAGRPLMVGGLEFDQQRTLLRRSTAFW
jgi:hypothetical protein